MRDNIFFYIILPILIGATVLASTFSALNVKKGYPNWWGEDRVSTIRFHYQTDHDYGLVIKSTDFALAKPGELFYGEWTIYNPTQDMELRIRNVVWPIAFKDYLQVNDIDEVMFIRKGERVVLSFYGYIDPTILIRSKKQPRNYNIFSNLQIFTPEDFQARQMVRQDLDIPMNQRVREYTGY